jgi:hypothetical protein
MSIVTTLPGDCCCTRTELTHLQAEQVLQCITLCTCTQIMQLFGGAVGVNVQYIVNLIRLRPKFDCLCASQLPLVLPQCVYEQLLASVVRYAALVM